MLGCSNVLSSYTHHVQLNLPNCEIGIFVANIRSIQLTVILANLIPGESFY